MYTDIEDEHELPLTGILPERFDAAGLSHSVVEDAAPEAVEGLEGDQVDIRLQQDSTRFSEWLGINGAIFNTFEHPAQNNMEDNFEFD